MLTVPVPLKPRWVSKRNFSRPLHPRLEITALTYAPLTQESNDIFQEQTTPSSESSTNSLQKLPQSELTSCNALGTLRQRFQSFNVLNWITEVAGSHVVFVTTLALLTLWAILGGVLGPSETWQIVMQDVSSIQCYVSDTLLMRQQQNAFLELLKTIGELRSRNQSLVRMLRTLNPTQQQEILERSRPGACRPCIPRKCKREACKKQRLRLTRWFDAMCDRMSTALGSLPALVVYATGVFIWVALGKMLAFSNLWQLYINTAVAVEITLTSIFLQHVRHQHTNSLRRCLSTIKKLDQELEDQIRSLTADSTPNCTIIIEPPMTAYMERIVDGYAYLVGSGFGAGLSMAVFVVWIAIGHLLQFNANWWLIIGTWTGLVGFMDAFVLRNVGYRQSGILDEQMQSLEEEEAALSSLFAEHAPDAGLESVESRGNWSTGVSRWFVVVTARWYMLVVAFCIVVSVLVIATSLRWSETGQLLANTPTMIIEGFLLLVLIQAHNIAIVKRRSEFGGVLGRREKLVNALRASADSEGVEMVTIEMARKEP